MKDKCIAIIQKQMIVKIIIWWRESWRTSMQVWKDSCGWFWQVLAQVSLTETCVGFQSLDCQSVSYLVGRSVSNNFFSEMSHSIFMKLHMKSWCLKGKKVTKLEFFEKNLTMEKYENTPKNRLFWGGIISPLMYSLFGFAWWTIVAFMILQNRMSLNNVVLEL